MLFVLVLIVILMTVLSACKDSGNNCAPNPDNAYSLTCPSDTINSVENWVKDTCPKNEQGNCKLMGEK